MKYDFTTKINRKNTGSVKWERMYDIDSNIDKEIIPLSVADMEFKNAPEIYNGLIDFLKDEPILGYSQPTAEYNQAVIDWQKNRHNWDIEKDWIVTVPGTVAAFSAAIRVFSNPGEGVIMFSPVYTPFGNSITNNQRKIVDVPLLEKDGYYTIDFAAFEDAASQIENKILLFCSPHNPVGRVWTEEELKKLADISLKYDLMIISDEVWYDFVQPEKKHTVFHKVNEELSKNMLTCTAASKTFNLAGAITSNIIISDQTVREKFSNEIEKSDVSHVNILGLEATRLAYVTGTDWLEELLEVIHENQKYVNKFFAENYPKIKAPVSEGTYVQWLDFRELGMEDEELEDFLNDIHFFANPGYMFGSNGSGFVRIVVVLPKEALKSSLQNLLTALKNRDSR